MTASTGSAAALTSAARTRDPAGGRPAVEAAGPAAPEVQHPGAGRRILIVVENLPVPFDRRVWAEATTLARAGYTVSVISPTGQGFEAEYEFLDGVHVYRHPLAVEGNNAFGQYLREYGSALRHQLRLAHKVRRERGIDILHGCNPPDLIFLIAWALRPYGVRYLFDHHDICPELYETKFGRRGALWRAMRLFERLTFRTALVSIATNESYARIARERGGMAPEDVFVVRSGPRLDKFRIVPPDPELRRGRALPRGLCGGDRPAGGARSAGGGGGASDRTDGPAATSSSALSATGRTGPRSRRWWWRRGWRTTSPSPAGHPMRSCWRCSTRRMSA